MFVKIGSRYINMDHVAVVDLKPDSVVIELAVSGQNSTEIITIKGNEAAWARVAFNSLFKNTSIII